MNDLSAEFIDSVGIPKSELHDQILKAMPTYKNLPYLKINKSTNKHGVSSITFCRWSGPIFLGLGKKEYQELVFTDYSAADFEYYEKGLAKLHVSFLDFMRHTNICHNAIYNNNNERILELFERFTIDTLPTNIYYMVTQFEAQRSDYMRFKKYIATVKYTIDSRVIDTIKYKLLMYLLNIYSNSSFNHENDTTYLGNTIDVREANIILDMFVYAPWCYLMLVYKHLNIQSGAIPISSTESMLQGLNTIVK